MIYEYKHKGKTHFEFEQDGMTHIIMYKDGIGVLYDQEGLAEALKELETMPWEWGFDVVELRRMDDAGKAASMFDDLYGVKGGPVGDALLCRKEDLTIEDLNEALHELSRLTKEIHEAAERHLKSEAKTINGNGPTVLMEV